jgi:hypothetical protein
MLRDNGPALNPPKVYLARLRMSGDTNPSSPGILDTQRGQAALKGRRGGGPSIAIAYSAPRVVSPMRRLKRRVVGQPVASSA